eukprot:TRINITY_DN1895_c3_g1_i1.p1 TRINITY_DN1895_c3_g1~~TRINITY_DN1895_c3_g1_i1.p1  ORF type:complete len:405 (-),score=232.35 TRINITY_DN1895_c3_g1_i1:59-1273(-)
MATENLDHKRLMFAVVEFLQEIGKSDSSVDIEGLEVACQVISSEFKINVQDEAQQKQFSINPLQLPQIFNLGLQVAQKNNQTATTTNTTSSNANLDPFEKFLKKLESTNFFNGVEKGSTEYNSRLEKAKQKYEQKIAQDKEKAEQLKLEGNQLLTSKEYQQAISKYTEAIKYNPENAIYYCNRAAAYSQLGQHEKAIEDSKLSILKDSKYSKAYSRLGFAYFSLEDYEEAINAYNKAIELDPTNNILKDSVALAKSKLEEKTPKNNDLASATASASNPGGLAGLMNNPALKASAQKFMQGMGGRQMPPAGGMGGIPNLNTEGGEGGPGGLPNLGPGGLAGLMNNPGFMRMAEQFMSDPSIAELARDPSVAQMAQQFLSDPSSMQNMMQMFGQGGNPQNQSEDKQ